MRSQVREALYAWLGDSVDGARVLDLFSGSGSLGLEALSRGASEVVFCERARVCHRVIEANLEALGLEGQAQILSVDLARGLGPLREHGAFELVVMDPPFDVLRRAPGHGQVCVRALLSELALSPTLADGGLVAFEAPARGFRVEPELADWGLSLRQRREYGTTSLWLLERASPGP